MLVLGLAASALTAAAPVARAAPAHRRPAAQVGFWTGQNTVQCASADSTTCPRDLSAYTPAVWGALRKGHGALYFDLIYTVDFGPGAFRNDALKIIRKANALGVTVKAWFEAPLSHGTWANENNAAFQDAAVRAFYGWRNAEHLRIDELVFDLEVPAGYQAVTDASDPAKLVANRGIIDPAHQCVAIRRYASTISWAHRHGIVVGGSPMPFLLDDLDDGNLALADTIDAGPLMPAAYDHLYLQAYRTYTDTGADYPAQYQLRMRHRFGRAGEISLGDTTMGPPYQSVAALVRDVRTAVTLGATAIPIFELASSVQKYGAAGILRVLNAGHDPLPVGELPAETQPTGMTKANLTFFHALDTAATAASPFANSYPNGCPVKVAPLQR